MTISIKKYILLTVLLLVIFIVYLTKLTVSGLWLDESIEYFYSKYMFGPLPGNIASGYNNMYERICYTFQPPLYNLLMYLWLNVADSEEWFRFAGVVTTFVGSIGIFFALKKLSNYYFGLAGLIVYLTTYSVQFYALECGEYNLVLCMECWALYFFCAVLEERNTKKKVKEIIGFFVFACLAAYSQYGAILLMVPLYLFLFCHFLISKDKQMIRCAIVGAIVVLIVAALPLLWFFLIPQMENQQISGVSHLPFFSESGILYSLCDGILKILKFNFGIFAQYIVLTCFLLIITTALYFKSKKLGAIIAEFFFVYLIYFSCVACSLYGYNSWYNKVGCDNLGGRYSLYLVPFIVIMTLTSLYVIASTLQGRYIGIIFKKVAIIVLIVFLGYGTIKLIVDNTTKDNTREVYKVWAENGGDHTYTIVLQRFNPQFQFYYLHGLHNHPDRIITGDWRRLASVNEIQTALDKLGTFNHKLIFFVGELQYRNVDIQSRFDKIMNNCGYEAKYLYKKGKVLALYTKK